MPTPEISATEIIRLLMQAVPAQAINDALAATGTRQQRTRKLPAVLVLQLVIALGLLQDMSRRQVLAHLLPPGAPLPARLSICRALLRLGPRPLRALLATQARPLATPDSVPQAYWRGLHLRVLDATLLNLPDTPANVAAFGRHRVRGGAALYPQLKLVTLAEVGTHALLDLRLRPGQRNERLPALELVRAHAAPGQLWLADCGFYGYKLLAELSRHGGQWLCRVPAHVKLARVRVLEDGSYLSRVAPPCALARQGAEPLAVRVVEYRVGERGKVIRLISSLLAAAVYPALELAALYHERWEVELIFDELKTHQQGRPNGKDTAIRAQTPRGVVQEVYGLALAHGVVRALMAAAAARARLDPDRLSFKNALVIVRRYVPRLAAATAEQGPPLLPGCWRKSAPSGCPGVSGGATSAG